ncbi:hypothetical protein Salat_0291800 [Sesamum alatum]|uniref:Uncharacterized protein n=1 Tax=Sesamum alatum TaxID=300844 RepID=A0AAE1Z0D6_9LAMI|nr:hypothetical protein Salat_0291800 [Sesamum alatum]
MSHFYCSKWPNRSSASNQAVLCLTDRVGSLTSLRELVSQQLTIFHGRFDRAHINLEHGQSLKMRIMSSFPPSHTGSSDQPGFSSYPDCLEKAKRYDSFPDKEVDSAGNLSSPDKVLGKDRNESSRRMQNLFLFV